VVGTLLWASDMVNSSNRPQSTPTNRWLEDSVHVVQLIYRPMLYMNTPFQTAFLFSIIVYLVDVFLCGGHFVKMAFSKISGEISGPIPTKPTLCTNARVSYTETKTRRQNISTICRRFKRCSKLVKVRLFHSYCVFYDTALWCNYSVGAINRLAL